MARYTVFHSRISPNTGNTIAMEALGQYLVGRYGFIVCDRKFPIRITSTGYPQAARFAVGGVEVWAGTLSEDFPTADLDIFDYFGDSETVTVSLTADDGYEARFSGIRIFRQSMVNGVAEAVAPDFLRWDDGGGEFISVWSSAETTYKVGETIATLPAMSGNTIAIPNGWAEVNGKVTLVSHICGGMMVYWACKDTGLMKAWCFEIVGKGTLDTAVTRDLGGGGVETRDASHFIDVRTVGCTQRDADYIRSINYSDAIDTADDGTGVPLYLLSEVPMVAKGETVTVALRFEVRSVNK